MDYLAHGIWSYNVYHRSRWPFYAVLFGVLPDTLSWVPYFFYRIFTGGLHWGAPALDKIPAWVFFLYGVSHSILVFALVFLLVAAVRRSWPVVMLAWGLHIVIDVFTHRREFLPTPFLWPVSDWRFPGISWANPWFMAVNYTLMLACLAWILGTRRVRPKASMSSERRGPDSG